jgi:AcrR family transcriptional regulator
VNQDLRHVRHVGVDTIVERSGVAKSSLYRLFRSKDDLVEAFLRAEDQQFWAQWDQVAASASDPRAELRAHLNWIGRYIAAPRFRGCPFLNAAAEFPSPDHQARAVCREHKAELRRRIKALAQAAGLADPGLLADQLTLVIDGAFANSEALGKHGPAHQLGQTGETLLRAAEHHQDR